MIETIFGDPHYGNWVIIVIIFTMFLPAALSVSVLFCWTWNRMFNATFIILAIVVVSSYFLPLGLCEALDCGGGSKYLRESTVAEAFMENDIPGDKFSYTLHGVHHYRDNISFFGYYVSLLHVDSPDRLLLLTIDCISFVQYLWCPLKRNSTSKCGLGVTDNWLCQNRKYSGVMNL